MGHAGPSGSFSAKERTSDSMRSICEFTRPISTLTKCLCKVIASCSERRVDTVNVELNSLDDANQWTWS